MKETLLYKKRYGETVQKVNKVYERLEGGKYLVLIFSKAAFILRSVAWEVKGGIVWGFTINQTHLLVMLT